MTCNVMTANGQHDKARKFGVVSCARSLSSRCAALGSIRVDEPGALSEVFNAVDSPLINNDGTPHDGLPITSTAKASQATTTWVWRSSQLLCCCCDFARSTSASTNFSGSNNSGKKAVQTTISQQYSGNCGNLVPSWLRRPIINYDSDSNQSRQSAGHQRNDITSTTSNNHKRSADRSNNNNNAENLRLQLLVTAAPRRKSTLTAPPPSSLPHTARSRASVSTFASSSADIYETARTSRLEEISNYATMAELVRTIRAEAGCEETSR